MTQNKIFIGTPPLKNRIWFYLTCWRPVTKYEFANLQLQLITILEGIRESDMQHYQTEKMLAEELKKLYDTVHGIGPRKDSDKKSEDQMFG
ncbi:MAG: hypothetical protein EHM34_00345 [Nitrosopumilales archaeon]|nr:MAG: hypothetical protein EHM34_00345 [Nitrosopumilales archaeon]